MIPLSVSEISADTFYCFMETGTGAFTLLPPVKVKPQCGDGGLQDFKKYKTISFLGISTRVNPCKAQGSVLQELGSTGACKA